MNENADVKPEFVNLIDIFEKGLCEYEELLEKLHSILCGLDDLTSMTKPTNKPQSTENVKTTELGKLRYFVQKFQQKNQLLINLIENLKRMV